MWSDDGWGGLLFQSQIKFLSPGVSTSVGHSVCTLAAVLVNETMAFVSRINLTPSCFSSHARTGEEGEGGQDRRRLRRRPRRQVPCKVRKIERPLTRQEKSRFVSTEEVDFTSVFYFRFFFFLKMWK